MDQMRGSFEGGNTNDEGAVHTQPGLGIDCLCIHRCVLNSTVMIEMVNQLTSRVKQLMNTSKATRRKAACLKPRAM